MPKYSETYTFEIYGTTNDSSTLIIDGTTLASGTGNHTANYRLTAGQTYTTALDYVHSPNSTWQMELHWSSRRRREPVGAGSFPEEAIEPAAPVGGNMSTPESLDGAGFGNAANGAAYLPMDGTGPLLNPASGDWDTGNVVKAAARTITSLTSLTYVCAYRHDGHVHPGPRKAGRRHHRPERNQSGE